MGVRHGCGLEGRTDTLLGKVTYKIYGTTTEWKGAIQEFRGSKTELNSEN